MARTSVFHCDSPFCTVSIDAEDDRDLLDVGWLMVTCTDDEDVEQEAHPHSYACLVEWANRRAEA